MVEARRKNGTKKKKNLSGHSSLYRRPVRMAAAEVGMRSLLILTPLHCQDMLWSLAPWRGPPIALEGSTTVLSQLALFLPSIEPKLTFDPFMLWKKMVCAWKAA